MDNDSQPRRLANPRRTTLASVRSPEERREQTAQTAARSHDETVDQQAS